MDANWKENMPPWPGGHLKSGRRLVQKNVGIGLAVGSRRDTMMVSHRTKSKRTAPAILPGLGPGHRLELGRPVVSRQLSALVQTNLAPAGQPLQDASSLVSNSGFEQQSNLRARAWRPRASGKWRGFSFQQSNMKLGRADPERRRGPRSPPSLEEPDGNLVGCSPELLWPQCSGSAPWPCRPNSQTHGHPFLRDQPSSSFSGLGNTVQVSAKATKAQGAELSSPPPSGHQECPVQPSPRLQGTSGCWTPDPMGWPFTLKDQFQQSAHPQALGSRVELSSESPHLLLSMRCLKWPTELLLLRASQNHPRPWPQSKWVTFPEVSPILTPGHPSPFTHPCRAVPPEATPHLIPGHPSPLILSHRTMSPVISPDLTPGHPSSLTHPCRAVPPEATPHLTPGHPSSLTLPHHTMSRVVSPDLSPGHPSPLTYPSRAMPPEATPHLTPGHPSPLTHPCRAVPPEATPYLTPGHPSPLTLSHCTVSPVVSPDLTLGHPSPLSLSHRTVSPVISPDLTPEHPSPLTHPSRAVPPEATPHLTPGHPSHLTHPYKAMPTEATPYLTPGHPSPLTLPHHTMSRVVSPDLTPGHPSLLSLSHCTVSPVVSPDLTPGHPSPLILSHSTMSLMISPDVTPGHPSPLTHPCRAVLPEANPHLIPGHPRPLTVSHSTVSSVVSPDLTLRHPSPITVSHSTVSPMVSPDLTPRHPSPLTLSHSTVSPVISPDLTPGYPSTLTLSHSTMSPMVSPDLTPRHPSPLTVSHSTVSPVISPDLTPRYPSTLTLSHSTMSPMVSPDLIPRYPSPLPSPHGPVIPGVSHSLTRGYPKLHTISSKTLTPEASPSQTPGYPNFSGPSSKVGFLDLKLGPPNPLTLSGSAWTPGNPTSSTLSHSPLTLDPSPSFPSLSHNGITLGAPPNLTLGYSIPHTLSDKTTTTKVSLKLTPGYSSLHLHPSKIKVPEVSTNLVPEYLSSSTYSHRDVTPEISPSLGCSQGMQQLTRAFGIPKTQDPGTKELGDFKLPSSGDRHGRPAPSFSPGTSAVNVFRAANPASFRQPHIAPCSTAFPQAFCDKLSLPSGRGTALGNPDQAVLACSERSSLPPSGKLACTSGSQVDGGQGLMETQLEGHLQQVWEMPVSLVPQDTNTPLPGPKEEAIPTHWGSQEEGTSLVSGGSSRQGPLKNAASGPHLSRQEGRLGSKTYCSASSSVGMHLLAQQQFEVAHRPNEQKDPWMEQSIAGNLGAGRQNRRELHLEVGASQQELEMGEKSPSVELLTPEAKESRALLSRCFKAWRWHLLRQRAAARALRRRHLLRKGIRAMRWCLWLREAQMEYMKRKQGRTVLAKSFQKWKDLYLNRREKLLTQSRTETPGKDLLLSQGGQPERSFVTLGVVCGVEGAPKIQLCPRWKPGSQDPRAPATRDLQRLAAFQLWYLQKVLVAEIRQEARARAELRKKKLQLVFQAWRARTMNAARICPLVTRHQRAQLDRCFGVWRRHTQRKTWCQGRLAHWRVETLRKSLQQWVKMVRLQAMHSRTMNQLYLYHQRSWHLEVAVAHEGSSRGPVSQGPGEQDQPCYHPEVRAKDSLEEACQKLKLHRVILLWSRRLAQHQRADSFSWSRKLQLLQNTLHWWRQKAQAAESPPASSANSPTDTSIGSQDSGGSSTSSGFLSSALAPLGPSTPRSSSEEAHRPTDSSSSFLSLAGDDLPWVLPLGLRPLSWETHEPWRIPFTLGQKWPQLWEWRQLLACSPPGEETGPWREALQVPRDPGHLDTPWPEAGWQQGSQRALEAKQHGRITPQSRVICSWSLRAAAQWVWWELVCQQRVWVLAQEALHHWHTFWQRQEALQELGHQWTQHGPDILKRRACGGWTRKASRQRNATSCQEIHFQAWHHMVLTALNLWVRLWIIQAIQRRTLADLAKVTNPQGQDWRTAVSQIYHSRQHGLLRPPWAHWNTALPRERPRHQLTKEEEDISVGPDAMHPWKLTIRGYHILCADSDALGKQVSNYWTRAIALAQAKRKPPSHTGPRKKSGSLGGPELILLLSFLGLPVHCKSFQLWLQSYQRQSRAKGLTSQEGPGKSTRQEEGSSRAVQIPKSRDPWRAAVLEETWLKRKYLWRWRHEVLLRRFHGQQRKRRLAEVWQCWIDAQGSEQLARTLVRQRRLEWGWGTWRRRWLQLQVALRLQDNHRALSQAFGRWYQHWASRVPKRGGISQ